MEAGDVKSLLEKFEATEAVVTKKLETKPVVNNSVNKSQEGLLKKTAKSLNSKPNKVATDFLPKEVVDRIKVTLSFTLLKQLRRVP